MYYNTRPPTEPQSVHICTRSVWRARCVLKRQCSLSLGGSALSSDCHANTACSDGTDLARSLFTTSHLRTIKAHTQCISRLCSSLSRQQQQSELDCSRLEEPWQSWGIELQFLSSTPFSKWIPISKRTRRTSRGGKIRLKPAILCLTCRQSQSHWCTEVTSPPLVGYFTQNDTTNPTKQRCLQHIAVTFCDILNELRSYKWLRIQCVFSPPSFSDCQEE